MHKTPHLALLLAALAAPLVAQTPAFAEDIAAAEALFNKGLADMEAGKYETGCKAIAESQRLDPRAGTLFTLATCEARWGRIATAVTRYGDYLATFDRLPDDRKAAQGERPNVARAERERLSPLIPQLTLSLAATAPKGTLVKRDGEAVSDAMFGLALPVDPGEHVLTVQAPGGPESEQKITIAQGEKKAVTVEPKIAAPTASVTATATSAPTASAPPSRSMVGPIAAFGAGVVGLGLGIGFGAAVLGKRPELDAACPNKACPASEKDNLEGTKTLGYVSTVGFVVAGVGAAVGTVLLLLPAPKAEAPAKSGARAVPPRAAVRVGAGWVGVEGAF